ncbi:MAG TPA: YraN family protein [Oligoflexia bacterium]|nr:YraN family protein [Oligoflexia bacterium]HMP26601.1 YraN family protein [Oligoflexia bacterium]
MGSAESGHDYQTVKISKLLAVNGPIVVQRKLTFFEVIEFWLRSCFLIRFGNEAWRERLLGAFGEKVAARFVERCGVTILRRNWKSWRGEIDLIGLDCGELIMLEVKTRFNNQQTKDFYPSDKVDWRKRRKLRQLADVFLKSPLSQRLLGEQRWELPIRFDIAGVKIAAKSVIIEYMAAAFADTDFY